MAPGRALSSRCCGGCWCRAESRQFVRYRIIAACAARAAAQKASCTKTCALKEAVFCPGFGRIFRTGWLVTTPDAKGKQSCRERCFIADQKRARRRGDMGVFVSHGAGLAERRATVIAIVILYQAASRFAFASSIAATAASRARSVDI